VSPALTVEQLLSQPSIDEDQPYTFNKDSLENLILDEAEQCYNRLVEAYAAKCINDIQHDVESSSIHEVPFIQNEIPEDNRYSTHVKPKLEDYLTKLQGNSADNNNHNVEINQEDVVSDITVIPLPNMDFHQNENGMHAQVVPSQSRALIFDTKDLD
jgi:hypothetical protein